MEATEVITASGLEAGGGTPATQRVVRCVTFVIGALGMLGNVFVVVVIVSGPAMRRTLTNRYIINQSVVDASAALLLILTTAIEDDGRVFDSILDQLFCRLWLTKVLLWGSFLTSTYNLLALTLERYLAVVHPIWHKLKLTDRKAFGSMLAVWLFGPAYTIVNATPAAYVTPDGLCRAYPTWPDATLQRAVGILAIFVQFLCPLCLLVFFYTRMIVVLRRRVASPPDAGEAPTGRAPTTGAVDTMAKARRNILKMLIIVAICFSLCWSSNQVYYLLYSVGLADIDFGNALYNFTVLMVFANCCINPFIYLLKYDEFRKTAKRLVARKLQIQPSRTSTTSTRRQ